MVTKNRKLGFDSLSSTIFDGYKKELSILNKIGNITNE